MGFGEAFLKAWRPHVWFRIPRELRAVMLSELSTLPMKLQPTVLKLVEFQVPRWSPPLTLRLFSNNVGLSWSTEDLFEQSLMPDSDEGFRDLNVRKIILSLIRFSRGVPITPAALIRKVRKLLLERQNGLQRLILGSRPKGRPKKGLELKMYIDQGTVSKIPTRKILL